MFTESALASLLEQHPVFIVIHVLVLAAGCGLMGFLVHRDAQLFDALRAQLFRGMGHADPIAGLSGQGPEFWLAMLFFTTGIVMLWSLLGVWPLLVQAVGTAGAMFGGALAALFRSTAFQIAVCWGLLYVGLSMSSIVLTQQIHAKHVLPAFRELDLPPAPQLDVNEQIRRFRDLIDDLDRI